MNSNDGNDQGRDTDDINDIIDMLVNTSELDVKKKDTGTPVNAIETVFNENFPTFIKKKKPKGLVKDLGIDVYYGGSTDAGDMVFSAIAYPITSNTDCVMVLLSQENRRWIIDFLQAREVDLDEYRETRSGDFWFRLEHVDKSPVPNKEVALKNMLQHVKKSAMESTRSPEKITSANQVVSDSTMLDVKVEFDDSLSEPFVRVYYIEHSDLFTGILVPRNIGDSMEITRYNTKDDVKLDSCNEEIFEHFSKVLKSICIDPGCYFFEEKSSYRYLYGTFAKEHAFYIKSRKKMNADVFAAFLEANPPSIVD